MNLSINDQGRKKRRWLRAIVAVIIVLVLLAGGGLGAARIWYDRNLQPAQSESSTIRIEIPLGSSIDQIAKILHDKRVIRSTLAFRTYVRSKEYSDSLKAGVFEFDPSKSVQDVVAILVNGDEASDLITIPPGLRLDQLKARFVKAGFTAAEVDAGFAPEQYKNHPALVSKPKDASLEGYLYPESFKKSSSTTVSDIITLSLNEMAKRLTPERIEGFARSGLTSHQAVILASIIEKEVVSPEDRRVVAQIFIRRLKEGTPLGSDVTYEYAAAITGDVASPELDSPYNTRKYDGLPPGPISNVDESALDAVANPATTNYLFFLSGDDDKTYYANTNEEHEKNIADHCQKKCQ